MTKLERIREEGIAKLKARALEMSLSWGALREFLAECESPRRVAKLVNQCRGKEEPERRRLVAGYLLGIVEKMDLGAVEQIQMLCANGPGWRDSLRNVVSLTESPKGLVEYLASYGPERWDAKKGFKG